MPAHVVSRLVTLRCLYLKVCFTNLILIAPEALLLGREDKMPQQTVEGRHHIVFQDETRVICYCTVGKRFDESEPPASQARTWFVAHLRRAEAADKERGRLTQKVLGS